MYHRIVDFILQITYYALTTLASEKKHSTFMAILNLTDKISPEIDNTKCSMGISITL